jgi:ADP-heptose:LPS heptosyltransferase
MKPFSGNPIIYAARSMDDAEQTVRDAEKSLFSHLPMRIFILLWVTVANAFLTLLRRLFFTPWNPSSEIGGIVVYTVGILGDNVVLLPSLATLRQHFSTATITVIINCQHWNQDAAEGILGHSPFKDRIIILNDHPVRREGFHFVYDKERFIDVPCDLFVNLSPFGNRGWLGAVLREMIFARFMGARHAVGFCMSTLSRGALFNPIQYRFVRNEPRRGAEVLRELNFDILISDDLLPVSKEAHDTVIAKLAAVGVRNKLFFVLNPGAKFRSKCWPAKRFGLVARHLFEKLGATSVVTGNAAEVEIANQVVVSSAECAVSLAGETTVSELIELLRLSSGCVTNDTGTMHLAALLEIPTVALLSTRHSPTHWLPQGKRIISLFTLPTCRYCYDDDCNEPMCLDAIDVATVVSHMDTLIAEAKEIRLNA